MPKIADIEGIGRVEFPDDATPEEITQQVNQLDLRRQMSAVREEDSVARWLSSPSIPKRVTSVVETAANLWPRMISSARETGIGIGKEMGATLRDPVRLAESYQAIRNPLFYNLANQSSAEAAQDADRELAKREWESLPLEEQKRQAAMDVLRGVSPAASEELRRQREGRPALRLNFGETELPKVSPQDLQALGVPEAPAKIAAGTQQAAAGFGEAFISPEGLLMVPQISGAKTAFVIGKAFLLQAGTAAPAQVVSGINALNKGDLETAARDLASAAIAAGLVGNEMINRPSAVPNQLLAPPIIEKGTPRADQIQGPVAPAGRVEPVRVQEAVARTEGAIPETPRTVKAEVAPAPAPIETAPKIEPSKPVVPDTNPDNLVPALKTKYGSIISGSVGQTHNDIYNAQGDVEGKLLRVEQPEHGFLLGGRFLSRSEASQLLGLSEPLQSETLIGLQTPPTPKPKEVKPSETQEKGQEVLTPTAQSEPVPIESAPLSTPKEQLYQVKGIGPQLFSIVERFPATPLEVQFGEQSVRVKNQRTGKLETVLENQLVAVSKSQEETSAKQTKPNLNAELKRLKLNPKDYPNKSAKLYAIKRANRDNELKGNAPTVKSPSESKGSVTIPTEKFVTPDEAIAEAKISDKVQTVASEEGQRSARQIKSELVERLKNQLAKAPDQVDAGNQEKVTISIPDDGTFTVLNTEEALSRTLDRAKRISTSTESKGYKESGPSTSGIPPNDINTIGDWEHAQEFHGLKESDTIADKSNVLLDLARKVNSVSPEEVTVKDVNLWIAERKASREAMSVKSLKQKYLSEQESIAAKFSEEGGESAKLAAERLDAAKKVVELPDSEFLDYVRDWKPLSAEELPSVPSSKVKKVVSSLESKRLKRSGKVGGAFGALSEAGVDIWNTGIDLAVKAIKAGAITAEAIESGWQHIKAGLEKLGEVFDEKALRIEYEHAVSETSSRLASEAGIINEVLDDPVVQSQIGAPPEKLTTQIFGKKLPVLSRQQLTPELMQQSSERAKALLLEAGFKEGDLQRNGYVWELSPEARANQGFEGTGKFNREIEARRLVDILQRELGKGRQESVLTRVLLDSVRANFTGDKVTSISKATKDELMSYAQGEVSLIGLLLGMSARLAKTVEYLGGNIETQLRQVYEARFGGDQIRSILKAAMTAFKGVLSESEIARIINENEAIKQLADTAKQSLATARQEVPTLPSLVKQVFDTPFWKQSELGQRFADLMVSELGLDPGQRAVAEKVFNTAFEEQFKLARAKAMEAATKALMGAGVKRTVARRKSLWTRIENAVNAGVFDVPEVISEHAKAHGLPALTPERAARIRSWTEQIQKLRVLPESERAKAKGDPAKLAELQNRWESRQLQEITELQARIQTEWSRLTRPFGLFDGRWKNTADALAEYASAAYLLKPFFITRQAADVAFQNIFHIQTRIMQHAWDMSMLNAQQGGKREFIQEFSRALLGGLKQQRDVIRPAVASTVASLAEHPKGRNVDALVNSQIRLFDRLQMQMREAIDQGDPAKATMYWLLSQVRWGRQWAAALDNLNQLPAESLEFRQQVIRSLRQNGMNRAQAEMAAEPIIGDMLADWRDAKVQAKEMDAVSGANHSAAQIVQSAWDIVVSNVYHRIRLSGLPADAIREKMELLKDRVGWNAPEEGGVGSLASAPLRALNRLGESYPLFAAVSIPFGRFSNAIHMGVNIAASATPLGFWPGAFGVTSLNIDPKTGIAKGGSVLYRTAEDRRQMKAMATIGSSVGSVMGLLIMSGAATYRGKPPDDPEERQLWLKTHKSGTVEFNNPDGTFYTLSLTTGPMRYVAPYIAAFGTLKEKSDEIAKRQAKLDAEALAKGLPPGEAKGLGWDDYMAIAGNAAWSTMMGGRTAAGLIGAVSDYGVPNPRKIAASAVSAFVPLAPAWQEIQRVRGVQLDSKLAGFFDYLWPLQSSGAAQVNLLGDKVGSESLAQRIIQTATGGSYPFALSEQEIKDHTAYKVLFASDYRPPTISPLKAYALGGELRPFNKSELSDYTVKRGQFLKEELNKLEGSIDSMTQAEAHKAAQTAYATANRRALEAVGVAIAPKPGPSAFSAPASSLGLPSAYRQRSGGSGLIRPSSVSGGSLLRMAGGATVRRPSSSLLRVRRSLTRRRRAIGGLRSNLLRYRRRGSSYRRRRIKLA